VGARAELSAECSDPELIVESQTLNLWPPNHKFHDVTVEDCVSAVSTCGGALTGEFIWASSDEPIDDIGDGHHFPDIGLGVDTGHVCVRSERQGPRDGRVYKLGVRVVDASGETVERECLVIVDHDQRGVTGVDSGESYRIEFDPAQAGLDCNGNPPDGNAGNGAAGEGAAGNGAAGNGSAGNGAAGNGGDAGEGDEGTAGNGGDAGEGDEGTAGNGGDAGEGDEGSAGNGGDPLPPDGGPD
jgi:hypothetical protein